MIQRNGNVMRLSETVKRSFRRLFSFGPGAIPVERAPGGAAVGLGGSKSAPHAIIELKNITKSYGHTCANRAASIEINRGEIVGMVGANGAGKSTLMRVLSGVTTPDNGTLAIRGARIEFRTFSPRLARSQGIRFVHQELSLCPNLSVTENFFLEDASLMAGRVRWKSYYKRRARFSIDSVFPGSGIDVSAPVGNLPIAQRQMVEIARAASDPNVSLVILDEPTSSLDAERSEQLRQFISKQAGEGVAFIFISHKLAEIGTVASRIVVMRDGSAVWEGPADTPISALVDSMGGSSTDTELSRSDTEDADNVRDFSANSSVVQIGGARVHDNFQGSEVVLKAGEIVGIGGLDGNGQSELLRDIFRQADRGDVRCCGAVGFISGDRQEEGVFPLWSVQENIAVSGNAKRSFLRHSLTHKDLVKIQRWLQKLKLDEDRLPSRITDLSGGNQQKALVARALFADADVILLDDPTRGVDVSVKQDFYEVIRELADKGKLVVWYSSEDLEFTYCDRVFVLKEGSIAEELGKDDLDKDRIVTSSFSVMNAGRHGGGETRDYARIDWRRWLFEMTPFVSTLMIFAVIGVINPRTVGSFGLDLLLGPAVPMVLVATAQMFVVGGSQIDLGVGTFAGLANVLSATILVSRPGWGALTLVGLLVGYGCIGALIEGRKIPAIVVTLGASFIWLGTGYTLQGTPGGSSPWWLTAVFSQSFVGIPAPVILVLVVGIGGWFINRSRVGIVLRGFGNNAIALEHMGWSAFRFAIIRYVIAGMFGVCAGLSLTAVNAGADINASESFTLLSVAAVVVGGCSLVGGAVMPIGVMFGALTLSLIGALLGFVGISTNYNALVQGVLLIGLLGLRTLLGKNEAR